VATEPINLREWTAPQPSGRTGRLFTCGRPGRATFGRAKVCPLVEILDRWARGLPQADVLHIVSLLGQKTTGFSEFDYYRFRSSTEAGSRPVFEDWLDSRYGRRFVIVEFPTVDGRGVPRDVLEGAANQVLNWLEAERTVIVIDSAGAERTARVCEAAGCRPIPER